MIISPYEKPKVIPCPNHPRVMLRCGDIDRIRQNISVHPDVATLWRELCRGELARCGATPDWGTYHLRDCLIMEARALELLLTPDREKAKKLISELCRMLGDFTSVGYMSARWGGHLIFTAAEIYDWCYDFLTERDKDTIIAYCEAIAKAHFEMGYPPSKQMAISGHGGEAQLLRDLLAFSIAVYDERPDIYDFCAGRIFEEYVPEYNALFGAGATPQGPSYGSYRFTCMLWSELLMRPLLGCALYTSTEPMAEGFYYFRLPSGQAVPLGDDFYATKSAHTRAHPFSVAMFLAYAATGRGEFLEDADGIEGYLIPDKYGIDYYEDGSWGEGLISPVSYLVFAGLTVPKSPRSRESVHHFGEPIGLTAYKKDDLYLLMKLGNFWGANHDHLDTGSFQIWYKGILSGESGVYDSYGAPHRKNYLIRTCAHNCLTVRAPLHIEDSGFSDDDPNDGGTRRPERGYEPKNYAFFREHYHMADTLSHTESEEEISLIGDLTAAYSHICEKVVRKMQFFPKEKRFVVTDEVTAKSADYKKEFLLHCETAPEINGDTVILQNENAHLVCRVIEPKEASITVLGGKGQRFVADGTDYPPEDLYDDHGLGWGRVVISLAKPHLTDRFVVEMLIIEHAQSSTTEVQI